jgi:hypothetical protein
MSIPNSTASLITTAVAEKMTSPTTYDQLFIQDVKNGWHDNITTTINNLLGLSKLGFKSLYSDEDYKDKLSYCAMTYNITDSDSADSGSQATIDYIINKSALTKIGELYDAAAENSNAGYDKEFMNKNMTWPLYGVMAYMNAIGINPGIITAKYDKYNKLYDMSYNTDYARAGNHSSVNDITVSNGRLIFSEDEKYAKPMIFSVINTHSTFDDDDIKYGYFRIRIRNVQIPMRTFRMSDHRYIVIAPEYLFTSRDQYDAITCIEFKSESLNSNWNISYSYATSLNDDTTASNQKMYPAIEYSTSNAFNLSVMTSSL